MFAISSAKTVAKLLNCEKCDLHPIGEKISVSLTWIIDRKDIIDTGSQYQKAIFGLLEPIGELLGIIYEKRIETLEKELADARKTLQVVREFHRP